PAWNPDGQHVAFAWTRGYAQGKFNVFIMDVGSRQYVQLTHDEGRNENPTFAPGGTHIAFMSNRSGHEQIYSMLADGSGVRVLTSQGYNYSPVWGK
ncbi:MAG: translocation protein TolB, partial [Bryobacteraceae bacterium]